MGAFVTFFFLSTTSVSSNLLTPTRLFTNDGKVHSMVLYYDPSVKIFGKEHLPYPLLGISFLTFFVPLVLLPIQDMSHLSDGLSSKWLNVGCFC